MQINIDDLDCIMDGLNAYEYKAGDCCEIYYQLMKKKLVSGKLSQYDCFVLKNQMESKLKSNGGIIVRYALYKAIKALKNYI